MLFTTLATLTLAAFGLCAPLEQRQANPDGNIALGIAGGRFDINYLQTYRISYANSSAYLGEIKYQAYSEPLITNSLTKSDGLSFLSIHQSPTGYVQMYVVPHKSQPLGFGVPHGGVPQGVRTTGFSFGKDGGLLNNGLNLFYACQNAALDDMHTFQIYWMAAGTPAGMSCRGPIKITAGDACARD